MNSTYQKCETVHTNPIDVLRKIAGGAPSYDVARRMLGRHRDIAGTVDREFDDIQAWARREFASAYYRGKLDRRDVGRGFARWEYSFRQANPAE